ncbi:MAG: polyhydroxyalkanoate synthesis repressor PhaR [Gammaproteobacteria bacterium]|nr:polyhydroxyalkanoate synthesis repressor PhaR [Gammaproteobacteria bacterium]
MTEHLIKKYPNRRLYDTQTSKYIKLTDLKDLIVSGAYIKVIDSGTEEDITRAILMQIIMETENSGEPMFSSAMLQQVIRFYGSSLQGVFAKYMEESMLLFCRQQDELKESFGSDPLSAMAKATQKNMEMWTNFQNSFFSAGTSSKDTDPEKS